MANNTGRNVKFFKNPNRDKPQKPYEPYVPNYQERGIQPAEYHRMIVPGVSGNQPVMVRPDPLPLDNPRAKRPAFQQKLKSKYTAQPTAIPVAQPGNRIIPNVGNNVEQVWSALDGEIVDDMQIDPNQPMIDNNDYMTDQALGYQNGATAQDLPESLQALPFRAQPFTVETSSSEDLFQIVTDLDYDNYLLIVSGVPICSGPQDQIEEQAQLFAFGQHETCDNNPVPLEDIIILKRSRVKVGLFLE
jgi:hypothetical protein